MRKARVYVDGVRAGVLEEHEPAKNYIFRYDPHYEGRPVSLTMPVAGREFFFDTFPPYFDGVLPEGPLLEALLRYAKIDRSDLFSQLLAVGSDLVGNITVEKGDEGN